jgi:hypothetical protein
MRSLKVTAAFLLSAAVSHAAIVFTIEAPGVQQSQVPGVITENFDDNNLTSVLGTYTGGSTNPASLFGGAGGTGFFLQNGPTTLTLNSPQFYFGMWWSAGDAANQLSFFDGATLVGSFNVGSIIPLLNSSYYGNPNPAFLGQDPNEPFAYLNFTATGTTQITSVVFGGGNFESDNHSVLNQRITPPGTALPDGGSTLALGGMALLSLAALKRFTNSRKA